MDNKSVFSTLGASNHSKEERQTEDFYASDRHAAAHLFNKCPQLLNCNSIVEPCAGDGTMADVISTITSKNVDMFDLVSRRDDIVELNYFDAEFSGKYDLIITNSPYKKGTKSNPGLADMIVKMLSDVKAGGYVCLLLKTLHLESQERYNKIFNSAPPEWVYVYSPRISCYRNNNTSLPQGAISYSWFVWHKQEDGTFSNEPPRLGWIEKL